MPMTVNVIPVFKFNVESVNGSVQLEVTTPDDTTFISFVLNEEQAKALQSTLDTTIGTTFGPEMTKYGISKAIFDDILPYCKSNQKINAIKLVRERAGMGLREAKIDVVDRIFADIEDGKL